MGYSCWLRKLFTDWRLLWCLLCHACMVLSGCLGSPRWWRGLLITSPQVERSSWDCAGCDTHCYFIIIIVIGHCDLVWIVSVFDHWGKVAWFGLFARCICRLLLCHCWGIIILLLNLRLLWDRIFLITVVEVAFRHFLKTFYLKYLPFINGKWGEVSCLDMLLSYILWCCANSVRKLWGTSSLLIVYHCLLLL